VEDFVEVGRDDRNGEEVTQEHSQECLCHWGVFVLADRLPSCVRASGRRCLQERELPQTQTEVCYREKPKRAA
jgi:hypothetical protein